MSMNDRSTMLANSLLEKGGDVELSEELPRVVDSLRYGIAKGNLSCEPYSTTITYYIAH